MDKFGGKIPNDFKQLILIPHIGPYTAGAILSLGYGQPAPMVDSNVERILKRAFENSLPEKAVLKRLHRVAGILVPNKKHDTFNLALLDLGALICTYRIPYCNRCPINSSCDTGIKTIDAILLTNDREERVPLKRGQQGEEEIHRLGAAPLRHGPQALAESQGSRETGPKRR